MATDMNRPGSFDDHGGKPGPNASPELQDAIRSIDAIGENAWGKDDDDDVSRGEEAGSGDPAATDPSLEDSPDGNPDAP